MRYRVEYFSGDPNVPCHVKCFMAADFGIARREADRGFDAAKVVFKATRYAMRDETGAVVCQSPEISN